MQKNRELAQLLFEAEEHNTVWEEKYTVLRRKWKKQKIEMKAQKIEIEEQKIELEERRKADVSAPCRAATPSTARSPPLSSAHDASAVP